MAKAKSNKIKIEDALVPAHEQPYEVPENWCWTYLNNIAQWGSGGTPSRKHPEYYGGNIPWIKTGELEDDYLYDSEERITEEAVANSSAKIFPENSVLIAMYGATIGKTAILAIPATTNQACACARCYDFINNKYLFYYLRSQKDAFIRKGKGGAQPNISQDIIKNHSVPLPPLAEQQRIVEQIERLFSKLDEVKEKAQGVLDSFEERRAAILHKAFEGELSRNWREKNNIARDTWNKVLFDDSIEKMQNGIAKRSGCEGALFGVLRLANLDENDINTKDLREIKLTLKEQDNYKLYPDDVIMIRVNGSRENVGRQILIKEDANLAFCDHIIRIRFRKEILPEYMVLFSKTDAYRYYIDEHMVSSAGQNTISRKGLGELYITLPSYEEQKEIVNVANSIIEREIEICEKAEIVLNEIDLMKKSILAKAFRGELGTTDASEESSIKLLKQFLEKG